MGEIGMGEIGIDYEHRRKIGQGIAGCLFSWLAESALERLGGAWAQDMASHRPPCPQKLQTERK